MSDEDRIAQLEAQLGAMRQKEVAEQDSADKRRLVMAVRQSQQAVDQAEKALADAFDDGDGTEIAKAQRKLAEATAEAKRVEVQAQGIANNRGWSRGSNNSGGDDELDTTNLDNWKSSHSDWYGVDKDMTKAAHEIDAAIRGAGVLEPGSREYFIAIDKQMAQKYPDRFRGTPPTGSGGGSHYPRGGTQRIEKEIAEGYRRMGIDIDDPVVAKRMIANRETAVQKGLLPAQKPSNLRVKSR